MDSADNRFGSAMLTPSLPPEPQGARPVAPGLVLGWREGRLELQESCPGGASLHADFVDGRVGYRRRQGGHRKEPLARAIGLGRLPDPIRVLDATAGLGRDAFRLACLGCCVTAVERSPIVFALLQDGLRRALEHGPTEQAIGGRLSISSVDAATWLADCEEEQRPDVIYLDPMHPERTKSATVRKEMRLIRQVVGGDSDATQLLTTARAFARHRVVVKRPARVEPLAPDVAASWTGKTTRYDAYLS